MMLKTIARPLHKNIQREIRPIVSLVVVTVDRFCRYQFHAFFSPSLCKTWSHAEKLMIALIL